MTYHSLVPFNAQKEFVGQQRNTIAANFGHITRVFYNKPSIRMVYYKIINHIRNPSNCHANSNIQVTLE